MATTKYEIQAGGPLTVEELAELILQEADKHHLATYFHSIRSRQIESLAHGVAAVMLPLLKGGRP